MKKFEVAETTTRVIDGKEVTDIKFLYDGIQGIYSKINTVDTDVTSVMYNNSQCIWGTANGIEGVFGRKFDIPKYEDFVSSMSKIFNISILYIILNIY